MGLACPRPPPTYCFFENRVHRSCLQCDLARVHLVSGLILAGKLGSGTELLAGSTREHFRFKPSFRLGVCHAADRSAGPSRYRCLCNSSDERERSPMFQTSQPIEHGPVEMTILPTGDGRRTAALPTQATPRTLPVSILFFPCLV